MSSFNRDFRLLHPSLIEGGAAICEAVQLMLPAGVTIRPISGHRTPTEQFEIFKKGRTFIDGHWVKTGSTYTNKDGFESLSRHNYLPSMAVDFGLFKKEAGGEVYIKDGERYRVIGPVAESLGFEWGGRWTSPFDPAHVQVSINRLLGQSLARGSASVWQGMLKDLGFYAGAIDGYFGDISSAALLACVGEAVRTPKAYLSLTQKHGDLTGQPVNPPKTPQP